ncbi:MAG: peptidase [Pseudomonadota bacterium]
MTADPEAVVSIARRWVGTPYVHQGSALGAGCDCLGLIRGIWRALFGAEPETVPAYSQDWAEPQRNEVLMQAAVRHLMRVERDAALEPAQVLLFRMKDGGIAKHLGVLSESAAEGARFIHAYSGHAVTESPLSQPWRRRIAARFHFPNEV